MNRSDGKGQFSSYVFLNEKKTKALFSKNNPDDFVKFGKYEMRARDKTLVENGYITKAKVKWYGGGFAYPYLWKANQSDNDYQEAWSNPRKAKTEKIKKEPEKQQNISNQLKKNAGRKM